ncbi:AraC family transcriptional regulator [Flexivirga caeni]|uniref:HTH-type transcriptional regulator RipA n=1 Tax=Flexivirga caeni TaxID=2294115 RepID=A0A3M9MH38_9MICO|nr:helix-turn-helix transcriptional regulator [Flexivirga caeni]RNI24467.1 AraC family transcriptional regulator [Flexivirga caeni]
MPEKSHILEDVLEMGSLPLLHGDRIPLHRHRQGHLVYPATGVLSVTTTQGTWIAPATRLVWTPGGFEHHHRAYGYTDMRVVFLPASLAAQLPDRPAVFAVSALLREAMLSLTNDTDTSRPQAARDRLQAVIIDELAPVCEEPLHLPEPRDDRLSALSAILHTDPANNATLTELGTQVGASKRTLNRLFHDQLGMSFRQWRTQLRLHHALTLLAAGHTVTNTAAACGWANPTSFIEAFSATLGTTPAHFRRDPAANPTTTPPPRTGSPAPPTNHNEPPRLYHGHDIDIINEQPGTVPPALLRWTPSATP